MADADESAATLDNRSGEMAGYLSNTDLDAQTTSAHGDSNKLNAEVEQLVSSETFVNLVNALNNSNNPVMNAARARVLGFDQEGVKIAPGANVRLGSSGVIGKNVFVGLFSYVNGDVVIEDDVLIGPHCSITSNTHQFNTKTQSFRGLNSNKRIIIGRGSWIAAGCMITAGVRLGRCNLICANTVVTKDTNDYAIVAGTPGVFVGKIVPETGEYRWFKSDKHGESEMMTLLDEV